MLKLPAALAHPPVPPPVSAQLPVTELPTRVVPFVAVPVTVPVRVRVLPFDCTTNVKGPVTELFVLTVRIINPLTVPPLTGKHTGVFGTWPFVTWVRN